MTIQPFGFVCTVEPEEMTSCIPLRGTSENQTHSLCVLRTQVPQIPSTLNQGQVHSHGQRQDVCPSWFRRSIFLKFMSSLPWAIKIKLQDALIIFYLDDN